MMFLPYYMYIYYIYERKKEFQDCLYVIYVAG